MNSILVIQPYKHGGLWVFDDPKVGLVQEPFISGADALIDRMVSNIPNAEAGVTLLFSARPFPGHQHVFHWQREEYGGNWYHSPDFGAEGWLCPALLKYFDVPPERIFVQVQSKSGC